MGTQAEATGCQADAHTHPTPPPRAFPQRDTDTIPAYPGVGASETYQHTLADEQFLPVTSKYHDLDAEFRLVQISGSPCDT